MSFKYYICPRTERLYKLDSDNVFYFLSSTLEWRKLHSFSMGIDDETTKLYYSPLKEISEEEAALRMLNNEF